MPTIPIHTLQFPDVILPSRHAFIDYYKQMVLTAELDKTAYYLENGGDIFLFHDDKLHTKKNRVPKIQAFYLDGIFGLRAYNKKAIRTLELWFHAFKEKHPEACEQLIETHETYTIKKTENEITYHSDTWLAFEDIHIEKGKLFFYNKVEKERREITQEVIEKRLKGNLLTFIGMMGITTNDYKITPKLVSWKAKRTNLLALKTIENQELIEVRRRPFSVTFTFNYTLPFYFALGQNVSFGNGLFTTHYEKKKTHPKRLTKTSSRFFSDQ